MWALIVRGFLWMSGGYVLNDATTTMGNYFNDDSSQKKSAPWWLLPLVVAGIVYSIYRLWLRKRRR